MGTSKFLSKHRTDYVQKLVARVASKATNPRPLHRPATVLGECMDRVCRGQQAIMVYGGRGMTTWFPTPLPVSSARKSCGVLEPPDLIPDKKLIIRTNLVRSGCVQFWFLLPPILIKNIDPRRVWITCHSAS